MDITLSIAFRSLGDVDPAQVRELLVRKSWKRDWSEERAERYVAWRYGERAGGDTLVACDQGRCVGILDLFIRPYWIADRQEIVRETCDWFCLPEYRALGVGLHLMRRMMAKPEPILVIGGTDVTQNLLPRLKWTRLPDVGNFILGVSARTVAGLVAHSRWQAGVKLARVGPEHPAGSPASPGGAPFGEQPGASPRRRRSRPDPQDGAVCACAHAGRDVSRLAGARTGCARSIPGAQFRLRWRARWNLDQSLAGAAVFRRPWRRSFTCMPHGLKSSIGWSARPSTNSSGEASAPSRAAHPVRPPPVPCPSSGFGGERRVRPIGGVPTSRRPPDRSI